MTRLLVAGVAACGIVLAVAAEARAELIVFTTGRTMSVKSYRVDGDTITVTLRHGGEAVFARTLVERIAPDEVPYPEESPNAGGATTLPSPAAPAAHAAKPFAALIARVAAKHGVDPALVHAVIEAESNYQPRARSRAGARGLMQVMPSTARDLGVAGPRRLFDPQENVEAGVRYLKAMLVRFDGDLPTALAAYNAGPGAVDRHSGIPPYPETLNYVRKVLGSLQ